MDKEILGVFVCIYSISIVLILSGIILMPYELGVSVLLILLGIFISLIFTILYNVLPSETETEKNKNMINTIVPPLYKL